MKGYKMDKEYNTHLVKLWLDNNRDNYLACGDMNSKKFRAIMNNDSTLLNWLHFREYGEDTYKIILRKDALYLDSIRQTIKDNMHEIYA